MLWPNNHSFAFTVFDDPDAQTLKGFRAVYDLLASINLRTTIGVWPTSPIREANSPGETCGNREYLDSVKKFKSSGFEIGYHNTTCHSSFRGEVISGLNRFREFFGNNPITMANHYNAEAIYWGSSRVSGLRQIIYKTAKLNSKEVFSGHIGTSPYFWGDICVERVRFCRNFTFDQINTLRACPWMPYHDADRSYVPFWFASSDASNVQSFLKLLSEENQDRLEDEGGACILYTHFGHGFFDGKEVHPRFRFLVERLAQKNGWFVPVGVLLEYLLKQRSEFQITKAQRSQMEWRWLAAKLLQGAS